MVRGDSQETAIKVNLSDRRQVLRSFLGGKNQESYYIFTLKHRSSFNFADVGQARYEEINVQPSGTGGQNYGWNLLEGNASYPENSPTVNAASLTAPAFVYDHSEGQSVTGGYVYRGSAIAGLQGAYVYGDFVSGKVWALHQTATGTWDNQLLLDANSVLSPSEPKFKLSTFGQDDKGNLYLTNFYGNGETNGVVYKIDPQ
jgi:Glucose / Sorbosone dehydrogenase